MNQKKINTAILLSIILLLAVNMIAYLTVQYSEHEEKQNIQSYNVIQITENLSNKISHAESYKRGYLLTKDDRFLREHLNNVEQIDTVYMILKGLVSNYPENNSTLDSLRIFLDKRIKLFTDSEAQLISDSQSLSSFAENTKQGSEYSAIIDKLIGIIQTRERIQLNIKISSIEDKSKNVIFFIFSGTAISVVILLIAWVQMNRSFHKKEEIHKKLETNRKWLSTILSGISDCLIAVDNLGDINYANPSAQKLLGKDERSLLGTSLNNIISFKNYDTDEKINDILISTFAQKQRIDGKKGLMKFDKAKELIVEISSSPLYDDNGTISGAILILNDVTEQVESEEKVEKFKHLADTVAEAVPNILFVYEAGSFNVLYSNNFVFDITSYKKEDLINTGKNIFREIIHPEDYDEFTKCNNELNENEIDDVILRVKNKYGLWRYFDFKFVAFKKDVYNNVTEILLSALDVNDMKLLEERMSKYNEKLEDDVLQRTSELNDANSKLLLEIDSKIQTEEFLKTIIDLNPNLIFVKDWDGRFTKVNKALCEIYGCRESELLGKTDSDFNSNKDEVEKFMNDDREVMTSLIPKFIPEENVTNSETGETRYYQTIKVPLNIENKRQVLGISTDITARKLSEQQILRSLDDKDLMLQEIHHRIKNNLQIIISLLKLQSKYVSNERDREIFEKSRARIETMSIIHEKLYKKTGKSTISLNGFTKELTQHLTKLYNSRLKKDVISTIEADNIEVGVDTIIPCGLILNELISNSIKYAEVNNDQLKIKLNLFRNNGSYRLIFSDNGKGLQGSVNELSENTLGLKIVNTLVHQLDGEINIDNSDGTKFIIDFRENIYKERI